jgi:hypothetical protein
LKLHGHSAEGCLELDELDEDEQKAADEDEEEEDDDLGAH